MIDKAKGKSKLRIGIVLAGGSGRRFGSEQPNQLIRLGGIPILYRTLKIFLEDKSLNTVVVVLPKSNFDSLSNLIKNDFQDSRIVITIGGKSRSESVHLGLKALNATVDGVVAIHDAVRPFLTVDTLRAGFELMESGEFDGINTVIETTDSLVEVDSAQKLVIAVPQRHKFRRGQTPQFFKIKKLKLAFQIVENTLEEYTEECGLMLDAFPNSKIGYIVGMESNIKITTTYDLLIAQNLLRVPRKMPEREPKKIDGVVTIVGGSSGVGRALKESLEKDSILVKSFSRREGQDLNQKIGRNQIIAWLASQLQPVHLVFTIGSLSSSYILSLNEQKVIEEFRTNLISIAMCISEVLQEKHINLLSITLLGSTAGYEGRAGFFSYSSAKAGLVALMQSIQDELRAMSIRINIIVPERIDNELRKRNFADSDKLALKEIDVAKAIRECMESELHGMIISIRAY